MTARTRLKLLLPMLVLLFAGAAYYSLVASRILILKGMQMTHATSDDAHAMEDVKQLGLFAAIGSLSYVFWIVGGMEMVERLAYYGVRAVAGLYATDAKSNGGLGVTAGDLGIIFLIWALFQAFIPVLFGGISDRIGYKKTIFISTVVKIVGYIIMGFYPTFWTAIHYLSGERVKRWPCKLERNLYKC